MEYRAKITKEGSATLAEFPDCSGCQTFAESGQDIAAVAKEALEGWLETHLAFGDVPPRPKARTGLAVRVNVQLSVKIELRLARHEKKLTQAALAKLAGVSQQMIAKVENPDYDAGLDVIEKVARALDCNVSIAFSKIRKSA